jgi:NADP-dependent 3-hydroxy acid dehydrogenase YdfG
MRGMKDKVIVITGASSGIGAALAEVVGGQGALPVLLARREGALREVAARSGPHALPIVADVTRRDDVQRALAAAVARFGHVDVWVNNAGRGISRLVSELSDEDIDEMMLVNVKAPLYGMQAAIEHFKTRGQGHIINVSSMLGRVPFAAIRSAYAASKHALNSLTANLRMELRASHPGIFVSSVHPGLVATEFGLNARHGGMDSRKLPGAQTPEEVASVIAGVIERPSADVYTRPGGRQMVVAYFGAEDMGQVEAQPPFATALAPKPEP